ncbi:hypothetical protein EIZ81_18385 [Escherichia coli]|nr:hypothetical protein [Escherichia coli]MQI21743.1 hypothetical protein [Escherichia coli]MQI35924.1 hypothetical protein [Escherichia coli]MQI50866.1 hypothetical protein [Escherichia coli]MQJ10506.1 hypothetical protein [Escherichia coli]
MVRVWERRSQTRTGRQTFGIARRRQVDYLSCEIISNATISNENESHSWQGGDQIFKTFAPNDRRQSLNLTLTRFF